MRKVKFKVGDKVYCPNANTKISIVREFGQVLALSFGKCHVPFDGHGVSTITQIPTVFHATAENHALLEQLYGIEFEAPSKPKNPKEIIQAMLDDGWHSVPCMLLATPEKLKKHLLLGVSDASRVNEKDIIPFDPKTGKAIIDYIDGKIVTE